MNTQGLIIHNLLCLSDDIGNIESHAKKKNDNISKRILSSVKDEISFMAKVMLNSPYFNDYLEDNIDFKIRLEGL